MTVRPQEENTNKLLQPVVEETSGDLEGDNGSSQGKELGGGEAETREQLEKKYQDVKDKVEEYLDDENGKGCRQPPIVKTPPQRTKDELERHQAIHTPYASWCKHCLAARAVRSQHPSRGRRAIVVPDIDTGVGPTKVSMDYMYLHERSGKYKEDAYNPTHMIMIEHTHGRCWAYRVPNKGIMDDAHWLPERMSQGLGNVGMKHTKIQLKFDQEPAIVSVQWVIQELRPNVILTNSPVGEPECNGRVKNTIRRVQEKAGALRHHQENHSRQNSIVDRKPHLYSIRYHQQHQLCEDVKRRS